MSVYLTFHNNLLLNTVMRKGLHGLLTGGLKILINDTLEFIKLKGLHILVVEGLNIL